MKDLIKALDAIVKWETDTWERMLTDEEEELRQLLVAYVAARIEKELPKYD